MDETKLEIIDHSKLIEVPPEIAVCPYCNGKLTIDAYEWSEYEDGWHLESFFMDCETEPEMGFDDWDDWLDAHSEMPYVYLLPVEEKVREWVNGKYRFGGF